MTKQEGGFFKKFLNLTIVTVGIYGSFIWLSKAQERITRKPYGEDKEFFVYPMFLVFCQCVSSSLFAYVKMKFFPFKSKNVHEVSTGLYGICSLFYCFAMFFSNAALLYVSYPTQILAKSCKMIPVLIADVIIAGKKYTLSKYLIVLLIAIGISVFMLDLGGKKGEESTTLGIIYLILSLICDGLTNGTQTKMRTKASKPDPDHMMFYINLFAVVFMGVGLLVSGQINPAINFCREHTEIVYNILEFCLTMSIGQVFIFWTIADYGTLFLALVTTTRKFFTILFSVFWFGNSLTNLQWLGVAIVFLGLMWDVFDGIEGKKSH